MRCANCQRPDALFKCGGACGGTVQYCSKDCAKKDWPNHNCAIGVGLDNDEGFWNDQTVLEFVKIFENPVLASDQFLLGRLVEATTLSQIKRLLRGRPIFQRHVGNLNLFHFCVLQHHFPMRLGILQENNGTHFELFQPDIDYKKAAEAILDQNLERIQLVLNNRTIELEYMQPEADMYSIYHILKTFYHKLFTNLPMQVRWAGVSYWKTITEEDRSLPSLNIDHLVEKVELEVYE